MGILCVGLRNVHFSTFFSDNKDVFFMNTIYNINEMKSDLHFITSEVVVKFKLILSC
jgi:hypothetical protein